MGNHIFLSGQENFKICRERGVYGGISHGPERAKYQQTNSEIIAGFEGIKVGDFVFFYVKNVGFYGLWKTTVRPFFDETRIWDNPEQVYPYRVCFEPAIRNFPQPVALNDILDLRDKGRIWTFDLGTFNKKSHHPITSDEGKELIRLLLRNNPVYFPVNPMPNPYLPREVPLPLKLDTDNKGQIEFEGYLNAWFMRSFALGKLRDIIGEYHDFLNHVPTSFNTVMDIFLTHITVVDSVEILHKFTCMELKTKMAYEEDLNQVIKYENWLTRKLANGDSEMVQSIVVAFEFEDKVLDYVNKRRGIEEKTVRLLKYRVTPSKNDIELTEVKF